MRDRLGGAAPKAWERSAVIAPGQNFILRALRRRFYNLLGYKNWRLFFVLVFLGKRDGADLAVVGTDSTTKYQSSGCGDGAAGGVVVRFARVGDTDCDGVCVSADYCGVVGDVAADGLPQGGKRVEVAGD